MELNPLLRRAVELGASDIHLKVGVPPILRRDGSLGPLEEAPIVTDRDVEGVLEVVGKRSPERYEAFVTGRLAAEHVLADRLDAYDAAVRSELDPLSSAGWGAKKALDRFPRAVFAIMRLPVTWRVLEKLMLGEVAHPGEARGAGRTAMKVIEGLARAA